MSTPADGLYQRVIGTGRWEAAGADRSELGRSGAHHRPRGSEDTQPGRISSHAERDNPVGVQTGNARLVGRP